MSSTSRQDGRPEADPPPERRARLRSVGSMVVFDIAGPLAVYYGAKAAGLADVSALILSGVLPAGGVILGVIRRRRVDAVGVLVLTGIVVGTAVGLASRSAHLVLLEGVVPTAVFGAVCLASLATSRPLMYRFAVQFMGPDSERGREFTGLWRHESFRRTFRTITIVWGVAYLFEAGFKAVIVESTSTSTAKTVSQVLPFVVFGVVAAWNVRYGKRKRAEGERLRVAAEREQVGSGREGRATGAAGAAEGPAPA